MTMAIILLHMFWGVVFFDACEKQRWWAVAAVVISHLIVSCLVSVAEGGGYGAMGAEVHVNTEQSRRRTSTKGGYLFTFCVFSCFVLMSVSRLLVQTFQNPEYVASLVPTYVILLLMGVWAFYSAGGSLRNLKLCLTCKDKDFLLANHRPR